MKKMDGWMEKQVILQKLKIPEMSLDLDKENVTFRKPRLAERRGGIEADFTIILATQYSICNTFWNLKYFRILAPLQTELSLANYNLFDAGCIHCSADAEEKAQAQ